MTYILHCTFFLIFLYFRSRVVAFILDIAGIVTGLILMVLLAGYEEDLKRALKGGDSH